MARPLYLARCSTARSLSIGSTLAILMIGFFSTAGCGGFSGQNSSTALNNQAQVGNGATGSTPISADWNALDVNGAVSGGVFGQTPVLSLDKVTKELVVRLPMSPNAGIDGATIHIPVPQLAGAKIGLEALPNGGSALTLRVPLAVLMNGITTGLNPAKLPNGDPLPGIPDGELPAVAVALMPSSKINATLYMSQAVLAVFVNSPFDPTIGMTFPIRDASREHTYGYFSTIPAKSKLAQGGFFLSIAIPDDIARVIDDNI